MKNIARALVLAIALSAAACSQDVARFWQAATTISEAKASPQMIFTAVHAFDAAEVLAASYLRLRICSTSSGPACRVPSATLQIKGAIYAGREARNELKAQLRANPDGVPLASYDSLVSATKVIENATAAYRAATNQ